MRGGLSYVTMLVVNPIIILFYQNCSVIPSDSLARMRSPMSVAHAEGVAPSPLKACVSYKTACPE